MQYFCILNALSLCPYLLVLVQEAFSGGHHRIFKICMSWESLRMICDTRKYLCVMMCYNTKSSQKAELWLFFSVALCLDESWACHKSTTRDSVSLILKAAAAVAARLSLAASAHPAATSGQVTQGRSPKGSTPCPTCAWAVQCGTGFSCILFFYVITKGNFVFLFSNKKLLQHF